MKQNSLRTPLINSAVILVVFSLLVYFTVSSSGGTLWSSIGAIIVLIFRTAQWAIGLALGLLVCLAVLIGIFLGAVSLVNGASASRMYEGLRQTILYWLEPIVSFFKSDKDAALQAGIDEMANTLRLDFTRMVRESQQKMTSVNGDLETKIGTLGSRLREIEEIAAHTASLEQLEAVNVEVSSASEALAANASMVKGLQDNVNKVVQQVGAIDAEQLLGDIPARIQTLEEQGVPEPVDLNPLQSQITALQEEIEHLKAELKEAKETPVAATVAEEAGEETEQEANKHRLFSYFEEKEDQDKIAALVAETLKKDMTYAQITKYLIKEMGSERGKILEEHPSLVKDFIRQCRRTI